MQLWVNPKKPGLLIAPALLTVLFKAQGTPLGSSTYFEEPPPEDPDALVAATNLGLGSFDGASILLGAPARPSSTPASSAKLVATAPLILGHDLSGLTQRSTGHTCHEAVGVVCSIRIGSSTQLEQHD